jgi:hypothetical protein
VASLLLPRTDPLELDLLTPPDLTGFPQLFDFRTDRDKVDWSALRAPRRLSTPVK